MPAPRSFCQDSSRTDRRGPAYPTTRTRARARRCRYVRPAVAIRCAFCLRVLCSAVSADRQLSRSTTSVERGVPSCPISRAAQRSSLWLRPRLARASSGPIEPRIGVLLEEPPRLVPAGDAPDVADLVDELGVGPAFPLQRAQHLAYHDRVELIRHGWTKMSPPCRSLALDDCPRDVQRIDEVLRSVRRLVSRPPERFAALSNSPLVEREANASRDGAGRSCSGSVRSNVSMSVAYATHALALCGEAGPISTRTTIPVLLAREPSNVATPTSPGCCIRAVRRIRVNSAGRAAESGAPPASTDRGPRIVTLLRWQDACAAFGDVAGKRGDHQRASPSFAGRTSGVPARTAGSRAASRAEDAGQPNRRLHDARASRAGLGFRSNHRHLARWCRTRAVRAALAEISVPVATLHPARRRQVNHRRASSVPGGRRPQHLRDRRRLPARRCRVRCADCKPGRSGDEVAPTPTVREMTAPTRTPGATGYKRQGTSSQIGSSYSTGPLASSPDAQRPSEHGDRLA
jgi:hypothetical protein